MPDKAERRAEEARSQKYNEKVTRQAEQELSPQALKDYKRVMDRRAQKGW